MEKYISSGKCIWVQLKILHVGDVISLKLNALLHWDLKFILPETVNSRKWGLSPTIHFLYQCHMVFHHGPAFRRQEAVLSPFILMGEMNVITDYDQFFRPVGTKIHVGPIFHRHISSEHSDTKMTFLSPWETWPCPLRRQKVCVPFHTIGTA